MSVGGIDWIRLGLPLRARSAFALVAGLVQLKFRLVLICLGLVELVLELALLIRRQAAQILLRLSQVAAAVAKKALRIGAVALPQDRESLVDTCIREVDPQLLPTGRGGPRAAELLFPQGQ